MPPMPPMPPGGMPGAPLGSGLSPTIASVVINSPATEAASYSATRTTLVGSMIPATTMSLYSPDCAPKPKFGVALVGQLTDHNRALDAGVLGDLSHRRLDGLAARP